MKPIKFGYVLSNTSNIYYEVYGKGQPLVLLHGNGENLHYFDSQIKAFAKNFLVIGIDSRGHGKSSFGTKKLNISTMADDVVEVMKHLNINMAYILGFSDGGNIALSIALEHTSYVQKLIISGANLNPKGVKKYIQIPIVWAYYFCSWISKYDKKAELKAQILGLMVNEPNFTLENLLNLKIPTLVMAGEKDMIIQKHTELIAKSIPGAQLCIIPKGDHFIASKMPEIFNKKVLTFLSKP